MGPFSFVTASLSLQGVLPGDAIVVSANSGVLNSPAIIISAYAISANSVTIQAYNSSNVSIVLNTDSYKVRVIH